MTASTRTCPLSRARTGWCWICGLAVMAACTPEPKTTNAPGPSPPSQRRHEPALAYPAGLTEATQRCCSDWRLPEARDVTGSWQHSPTKGSAAFFVEGDFDGDGLKDAAVLLVDSSGKRVELAIFHARVGGGYVHAYRRGLARVGDVSIGSPQEIALVLVRKGEDWAPEGGDVQQRFPHEHDAVVFETHKVNEHGSRIHYQQMVYRRGRRYAEY